MVLAVIVDDEFDHQSTFGEILETMSITVVGMGINGKEAVELYEKHQPDVIFLDLMMPDYDGYYAIEKIKKISNDAKIVVITADVGSDSRLRLQKLGIDSILYKPLQISQIKQILTEKLKIQL